MQKNNEFTDAAGKPFTTLFDCEMAKNNKRQLTPWLLETCLQKIIGNNPKSIRSKSKPVFTVDVATADEGKMMKTLTNINGISAKSTANTTLNICKGLGYVYSYNLADFPSSRSDIRSQHGLIDVIGSHGLKSNWNNRAKPLLLIFRDELSPFLYIQGENMKTKIYKYKEKPLMYKACLSFVHSKNRCQDAVRCAKSGERRHTLPDCST